jgi:hypothetical protein
MNPKKIFDFIGEKNPKYELENFVKWYHWYDPKIIKFIDDTSEEFQLDVIKKGAHLIKYIKNPTEKVQHEAVKRDPQSIGYIEKPSERAQLMSVKKSALNIQFIKNPSEKVQLKVINTIPDLFKWIKNPTDKVKNFYIEMLHEELEYYEDVVTRKPNVTFVKPKLEKIVKKLKELELPHDNILYLKIQEIIKKMNK